MLKIKQLGPKRGQLSGYYKGEYCHRIFERREEAERAEREGTPELEEKMVILRLPDMT